MNSHRKFLLFATVQLLLVGELLGQGQVLLSNKNTAAGIDAPASVYGWRLDGAYGWVAQLYGGLSLDSLQPLDSAVTFRTGANAGYIAPVIVTTPWPAGTKATFVMHVWNSADGASYESVLASGGLSGRFNPVQVRVSNAQSFPPETPADLAGLQPLCLALLSGTCAANSPPGLNPIADQALDELAYLAIPIQVTGGGTNRSIVLAPGVPEGSQVLPADPGAGYDAIFAWRPAEGQGPGLFPVTVEVRLPGYELGKDRNYWPQTTFRAASSFTVTVREVNAPPQLAPPPDRQVELGESIELTATAVDHDWPANEVRFHLDPATAPGASLDATTGKFAWTPGAAGTFSPRICVADNGVPVAETCRTFQVVVKETPPPIIHLQINRSATALDILMDKGRKGRTYELQVCPEFAPGAGPVWVTVAETPYDGGPLVFTELWRPDVWGKFYRVVEKAVAPSH